MDNVLLGVAVALLVLTLATLWTFMVQLLRQQGRVLLRLDVLEQALTGGAIGAAGNGARAAGPRGLAPGTAIEEFRLPDLSGREVALEDYRGKRLLLVHWSPQCGFCDMIAPELAKLEPKLRNRNTEIVYVSYGDADANRRLAEEHGISAPILLADGNRVSAFETMGTPTVYLLDEQGKVARPVAIGANEVPELVREAADGRKRLASERSLAESRLEREGLKAGTPAPEFSLPTVDGDNVSLADYRGRRVLLVFSDPHCGPCDALAPELARLHREHSDDELALVMVGRGEPEENRQKAREHGIEFPVVMQDRWKLSKQYGIFATPVAFLIDEQGVIARDVAGGADEILALAHEGAAATVPV